MTFRRLILSAALTLSIAAMAAAQHDHSKGKEAQTKPAATKSAKSALKPAEGASIKIVAPSKNQVFKGDKLDIRYKLTKGKHGHHAHAYVDGELMGMFETEKGTLNGIKPGKHILELRVVADDHESELDAKDRVEFIAK